MRRRGEPAPANDGGGGESSPGFVAPARRAAPRRAVLHPRRLLSTAPQIARVPQHAARLLFASPLPPLLPSPLPPRATTPPTCRSQAIADGPFPCAVPHHTTPRRAHARAHARARFDVHPRVVVNALTGSLLHLRHQDAPGVVPDQEGGGYVRRERGLRSGGCGAICAWIPPCARSAALRLRAAGLPPQAATTPGLWYQVVISYPRMPIIMRPLSRRAAGAGAMLWPQRRRAAEHARCGGARSFAMGAPADAPLLPAQASRRAQASRGT